MAAQLMQDIHALLVIKQEGMIVQRHAEMDFTMEINGGITLMLMSATMETRGQEMDAMVLAD